MPSVTEFSTRRGFEHAIKSAHHDFRPLAEAALPHPCHLPPLLAKLPADAAVAAPVGYNLHPPELAPRFRGPVTTRASMPEATVDEDREFLLGEREVGSARQREVPPPANDSVCAQQREHPHLGCLVTSG